MKEINANIAGVPIFGDNMALKRDKVLVNKDKYFDERYFIFPFVCEKYKNEFWFEHGLRPDTELQLLLPKNYKPKNIDNDWGYRLDVSELGKRYFRYITPKTKFCDICSKDIEYIIEKHPQKADFLEHLALWLDGKSVDKL